MDPISIGLGIAGLGMKIFGGLGASEDASRIHQAQLGIQAQESYSNDQRHDAMLLSSRRQQLEIFRNQQRARALATNSAVSQGAQFGSGLQGGLAQINDQSATNLLGVNQGLQISQNLYGASAAITKLNSQLSDAQTSMSNNQGLMSLGGSLLTAGPTIGNMAKGFGGFGFLMGGGSPSGYGK